jgi:hypothetical protein
MVVFVVEAEAERQINIDRVREIETSNTLILSQLISCCPVTDMISSTHTVAYGMVIADLADKVGGHNVIYGPPSVAASVASAAVTTSIANGISTPGFDVTVPCLWYSRGWHIQHVIFDPDTTI